MEMKELPCGHCGQLQLVARCPACGRWWVVTKERLQGQGRPFDARPALAADMEGLELVCDFCDLSLAGGAAAVAAGMRQTTCVKCHTEFLSGHGLSGAASESPPTDRGDVTEGGFGSCCNDLRKAMTGPPESLFRVEPDGVLFLSVGYARTERGVGWFDAAVFFCPFCGAKLQDRSTLRSAKPPGVH